MTAPEEEIPDTEVVYTIVGGRVAYRHPSASGPGDGMRPRRAGSGGVKLLGGQWRGRRLETPAGIRPTQARVREALFSRWGDRIERCRFLELYAGSGSVSLEALSRGACSSLAVDRDRRALDCMEVNRDRLGAGGLRIALAELPERLARVTAGEAAFDLAFADPPYDADGPRATPGRGRRVDDGRRTARPGAFEPAATTRGCGSAVAEGNAALRRQCARLLRVTPKRCDPRRLETAPRAGHRTHRSEPGWCERGDSNPHGIATTRT